jgi:flavin reductase (DIM6/NTAB) family NADH-FMN oxidoreductase RutF
VEEHPAQDPLYQLLRHLTLPVVAVTTRAGDERNGMISNSAQRASLVPSAPRVSVYISKINHTHDLVLRTGVLGLHLLRADQWELIRRLGLRSGRDVDKLRGLAWRDGAATGCPVLAEVAAAFECRVVNAMDAGAATFFLADIVASEAGAPGPVMTAAHFREHMPDDLRAAYEEGLRIAQRLLEPLSGAVDAGWCWRGPRSAD